MYFYFSVTRLIKALFSSLVSLISLEMKRRLNSMTRLFLAVAVAGSYGRKKPPPLLHSCVCIGEESKDSVPVNSAHSACKNVVLMQPDLEKK